MPPPLDTALRLGLAAIVGGCVGMDRELTHKAAGLRTHMLLSVGAALFVLVATGVEHPPGDGDMGRVLQGLVTGIGFLSAGQILRRGLPVGLTTAADLWVVGGLGAACGLGAYGVAIGVTLLVMAILRGLLLVERRLNAGAQSVSSPRHHARNAEGG